MYDPTEAVKALAMVIDALLKVRESVRKGDVPSGEIQQAIDLLVEAVALQADMTQRIIGNAELGIDHTGKLIELVENLAGEVADLHQKVADLGG